MDFTQFKERYIAKMVGTGVYTTEELENDESFTLQLHMFYVGFIVYSEYQHEMNKNAYKAQLQAKREARAQPKIYVPNGGVLH